MTIAISSELTQPKCMPDAFNVMIDFGTLTLGDDYDADGGGVNMSDLSDFFRYLLFLHLSCADGYTFEYNSTTDRVKVFLAGIEVADGQDLDTLLGSVQYFAIGYRT